MSLVSIGVIGVGGFGRHHPRVLSEIPEFELVGIYDLEPSRAFEIAGSVGTKSFLTLEALLDAVEAVCVSVPTSLHADVAVKALKAGKHVFVEKPIAADLRDADAIIAAAEAAGSKLAVGQIERFNPAFSAATRDFTGLRFMRAERLGVWVGTNIDVDIVIDLMIHDIDLLVSLDPSEAVEIRAGGSAVLAATADIANARIELESGAVAVLDASRISRARHRSIRLYSEDRYLSIDMLNRKAFSAARSEEEGCAEIIRAEIEVEEREPLKEELGAFRRLIDGEPSRIATGIESRKSLALALAVSEAVRKSR
jgi:predicted dehydrogenase